MKVKIILIITFSINLLFSEISEGIVLLSDYEYDKAVLINIDDEIIHLLQKYFFVTKILFALKIVVRWQYICFVKVYIYLYVKIPLQIRNFQLHYVT